MAAVSELARLRREIDGLVRAVELDMRPGSRSPMTPEAKRRLKSEIETCMQTLDELRNRLGG
ncbi:hypothetical protein EMQ25_01980 [Arsenicitalea aurantiaca]|uniref:Uncharacterized protein n=1 Tax=Arsenicitalea aurantiaca TaxID=1783274 RepID=A0A433XKZ4_9HYPH|nr:hypothetical protein [Arsenicitalea aurantiaca]RUT34756.1 hypothetical protein EMQ25_01980 [Arsenicitalea aurantiaca]